MTDQQFRDFIDLLMISTPWPLSEEADESLKDLADNEARIRGYDNWTEAHREFWLVDALHAERICNHTWKGARREVPDSMPVNHVCALVEHHQGVCACSCGVVELRRRENPPLAGFLQ